MRVPGVVALAAFLAGSAASAAVDEFVVIVHPTVSGTRIRRADLAPLFLKQVTQWGNGATAVPVDQSGASAVRKAFSESVLGMSPTAAPQYWQKRMLSSNPARPPAVKGTDEEVIAFVAKTKGAVGYVSTAAVLPPEVKTIAILE